MIGECVYCEQPKEVRVWNEEKVCYDCRADLINQKFDDELKALDIDFDFRTRRLNGF